MFGPHLTLDLYLCNKEKLSDVDFIHDFLDELPNLIGMRKISSPQIVEYPGDAKTFDRGGISAFILIAESHISVHTFVKQRFASLDIFSCKDFDIKKAESYIAERFEPQKIEKHIISRGVEFPKVVEKAKQMVKESRKKISISS